MVLQAHTNQATTGNIKMNSRGCRYRYDDVRMVGRKRRMALRGTKVPCVPGNAHMFGGVTRNISASGH